jgi:hypothetical protein
MFGGIPVEPMLAGVLRPHCQSCFFNSMLTGWFVRWLPGQEVDIVWEPLVQQPIQVPVDISTLGICPGSPLVTQHVPRVESTNLVSGKSCSKAPCWTGNKSPWRLSQWFKVLLPPGLHLISFDLWSPIKKIDSSEKKNQRVKFSETNLDILRRFWFENRAPHSTG